MSGKNINKQPDENICSFCNKNRIDRDNTNVCDECLREFFEDTE